MVRGVIFDMDGLMLDTERLGTKMWKKAGEEMGIEIPIEFIDRFRGHNSASVQKMFAERYGQEFDFKKCHQIEIKSLDQYMKENGVPLKKGLICLLEYLSDSGIKMAVATSTQKNRAEWRLKEAGIFQYFQTIVCGDMVERSKPYPDIFWCAAEKIQIPIQECLVLEDSPSGLGAAKASGAYAIHIPDVAYVPEEMKEGITAEFDSLSEVISWLEKENFDRHE